MSLSHGEYDVTQYNRVAVGKVTIQYYPVSSKVFVARGEKCCKPECQTCVNLLSQSLHRMHVQ